MWCEPCILELKALSFLNEKYEKKGITILAINLDSPKSMAKVKSFIKAHEYRFLVGLDPNSRLFENFNGKALPFSMVIDQSGRIIEKRTGYVPGDEKSLEEAFIKLLSAQPERNAK
jgi:peroxiredoxin